MLLDNDRQSHWFAGALLAWALATLVLFLPVFHLLFRISIERTLIGAGILCAGQLIATPWLFAARATSGNPSGQIALRAVTVVVWLTLSTLGLFSYILWNSPGNPGVPVWSCMLGTPLAFGLTGLLAIHLKHRRSRIATTRKEP
jgi:hypothetical protein